MEALCDFFGGDELCIERPMTQACSESMEDISQRSSRVPLSCLRQDAPPAWEKFSLDTRLS